MKQWWWIYFLACFALNATETRPIVNSQDPKDVAPTSEAVLAAMKLPEGFNPTLFAGDPDVGQPIAFTFDDRGRLWVAESYTYEKRGQYTDQMQDRVVIFEDTNHDGVHDKRTVFVDGLHQLTGIEWGFGGIWVLTAPTMQFIPDEDFDDVPDGKGTVVLDGFTTRAGHNTVNGLKWGLDGWLWGRHGITSTSAIIAPGSSEPVVVDCCIWRIHPETHRFEVVVHGTTNPWGLDYTPEGEWFFSNNVIGHFWHLVPGAHYKRMHGQDPNPHVYQLLDQCADHYHWDNSASWTKSRSGAGDFGGGHSHCGLMLYYGDNWPAKYRGKAFMCNTHGRRVNCDAIARSGSGFTATHEPDFLFVENPWFKGVQLEYGPDGGVYLSDWTDLGECHDNDGVHRTSGRIYKITYGEPEKVLRRPLREMSNLELVELHEHRNQWFVRHARRILQERRLVEGPIGEANWALRKLMEKKQDEVRMNAFWSLVAMGEMTDEALVELVENGNPAMRVAGIRALGGKAGKLRFVIRSERDLRVLLEYASAIRLIDGEAAWAFAMNLAVNPEFAQDEQGMLMLWYALEDKVAANTSNALEVMAYTPSTLLKRHIARRIAFDIERFPEAVEDLVERMKEPKNRASILAGMSEALHGFGKVQAAKNWVETTRQYPDLDQEQLAQLNEVFGEGPPVEALRKAAVNKKLPMEARNNAIRALARAKDPATPKLLFLLLGDRYTQLAAIKALEAFDHPEIGPKLVSYYHAYQEPARRAFFPVMVARHTNASALVRGIMDGVIPREHLSAFHARQILGFEDETLNKELAECWGEVRNASEEKEAEIKRYSALLTPERLAAANASKGRLLFEQTCGTCHKLFGKGGVIGPDLTGADRGSLYYLLENILDPSAIVPDAYKMNVVHRKDGSVVAGALAEQNERMVVIQTQLEPVTVPRADIAKLEVVNESTMPDGLLQTLEEKQVADLIAYLQSKKQVAPAP